MSELATVRRRTTGGHMLHGSLWMISLRWALRLTGVVSTVILARLLSPADFGVVAAAMIVVGMLEMFNQTGQKLVLIRIPDPVREHYDSAWSISILIGLGIGAAIFLVAPLTPMYFHDPRTVLVMQCLGLRAVLGGFENIGIVNLRRNLQFDRFFLYNVYSKLASFVVTIAVAFTVRNYWALVAGILTGAIATNILSYVMSDFRPRFSLAKAREIWGFSIWTLVRAIAYYLNGQADLLAVGGFASAAWMGRYAVAHSVAASPTEEVNGPMVAVLFPVMATVQNDAGELRRLYLRALGWSAVICASTSTGVAMISSDLMTLMLGPKWIQAIPLIPWLALSAGVLGLASGAFGTFDNLNMPRRGARLALVRLAMLVAVVAPVAYFTHELVPVAAARLVVTILFIPTLLLAVGRAVGVSPKSQLAMLWRPIFAAGVMALAIGSANSFLAGGPVRLVLDVALGSLVYAAVLLATWEIAGRPASPEGDVFLLLGNLLGRVRMGLFPRFRPAASAPLRVCLYVAVPRSTQSRQLLWRAHNFTRRIWYLAKDLVRFHVSGHLRIDHLHYRSPGDHNKGDVLIREAIRQQIRASFAPRQVIFSEVGWGLLDSEAVGKINASTDLFVVAGSGYLFFDEHGELPPRIRTDAVHFRGIRCRKIIYGAGCNYVIKRPTDDISRLPEITPASLGLIRELGRQMDAISLRDEVAADMMAELSGQSVHVMGDPVLFYESKRKLHRSRPPAAAAKLLIGINIAVHGPISAGNFARNFDAICRLLRQLRERHDAKLVYICHLRADGIVPLLLRFRGIQTRRRMPSADALPDAYGDLDLNICQMMHSSILSLRCDVPTINLAYDVKNMTFFRLMGLTEFCLPIASFDVESVLALAETAIIDRAAIRQRIEDAKRRLKTNSDAFRGLMVAMMGDREPVPSAPASNLLAVI